MPHPNGKQRGERNTKSKFINAAQKPNEENYKKTHTAILGRFVHKNREKTETVVIDSGCPVNILDIKVVQNLKMKHLIKNSSETISWGGVTPVNTYGKLETIFKIGNKQFTGKFFVTDAKITLLGREFLIAQKLWLSAYENLLEHRDQNNHFFLETFEITLTAQNKAYFITDTRSPNLNYEKHHILNYIDYDSEDWLGDFEIAPAGEIPSDKCYVPEEKDFDLNQISFGVANPEQKEKLRQLVLEHKRVFSWEEQIGFAPEFEHKIKLKESHKDKTISVKAYTRSPEEEEEISRHVKDMLRLGIVKPVEGVKYVTEPVMVSKKNDTKRRFAVNYVKLNEATEDEVQILPNPNRLLDKAAGRKYYCTLDLSSAYWCVPLREEDIEKTTFRTRDGLYAFVRMPFGLKSAVNTF